MGAISSEEIEKFRSFSRYFTERIALLEEHYAESGLSLTEARIIYALGQETVMTSKALCEKLGLDAGYVSRILKAFEARELVHKRASTTDRRSIDVLLALKGRKLHDHFQESINEAVGRLLGDMSGQKRMQMMRALQFIERSFGDPAAMPGVQYRTPQTGDISYVVYRQALLYYQAYGWDQRFESLLHHIADEFVMKFKPDRERAWIAEYGGEIVGSIFIVEQEPDIAQLRMLYVEPHVQGMGIGKKLLEKAVEFARDKNYRSVRLWTNDVLHRARMMYERAGFRMLESMPNTEFGEGLTAQIWELVLMRSYRFDVPSGPASPVKL